MEGNLLNPSRVIADKREMRSSIPSLLRSMGLRVEFQTLAVGDYVVTSGYVIERKAVHDFIYSLYSGRLFDQVSRLAESYGEYLIIVEGEFLPVLEHLRNPRSIWGAVVSLIFDYGGYILFTGNVTETASLLYVLASRETRRRNVKPIVFKKVRSRTIEETSFNVLGSLPGIGPVLAERLLTHFGTLRKVLSASTAELSMVNGISRMKAGSIVKILDTKYSEDHDPSQSKLED
jgi:ERCC4-type nuclease